ncbi:MAG: HAMP domain-containing histidine kinase [Bacteriovorax sp.]|nr:HAMP domain-containing histidine kinase [Bacteriovorax sp.]
MFVFINFAIYLLLHNRMKERIFRELAIYWLLVLFVFLVEGAFQSGNYNLSAVFIVNIFPIYIMARFLMRSYGLQLISIKKYFIFSIISLVLAKINYELGMPFIVLSMPVVLVASLPLLEGIYATFITKRHEASFIQKFMAGFVFSYGVICSLHYAVRRLVPGAELIGFGSAFLNYIIASIVLPVFAIQELNKEKTEKLEHLVKERTSELLSSKIQKEKLLRVVVHDISNALQVLILQTNRLANSDDSKVVEASGRLMKNLDAISDITRHVRELEYSKSRKITLKPLDVEECFTDIKDLFFERFELKNVTLTLINKVSKDSVIKVDRVTFIHSVAANIISNALKFSYPGSEVVVTAYEDTGLIYLDVQDFGVGMDEHGLSGLFEFDKSFTTTGTNGERGTGFGMPLVKNYTEIFGGKVQAYSSQNKEASGTRILVSLPAVNSIDQATSLN